MANRFASVWPAIAAVAALSVVTAGVVKHRMVVEAPTAPKMYVPIVLAYEGGAYVGLKEFEAPTSTEEECAAKVLNEIAQIKGEAPPDAVIHGICPAIPKADVPSPAQPTIRHEQDGTI